MAKIDLDKLSLEELKALQKDVAKAIHRFGPPEIMNTDRGSQFTSFAWTDRLKRIGTRISMDGKGRCLDNIWTCRGIVPLL